MLNFNFIFKFLTISLVLSVEQLSEMQTSISFKFARSFEIQIEFKQLPKLLDLLNVGIQIDSVVTKIY